MVHKIYDIVSSGPYFELLCGSIQQWVVISSPPQLTTDLQSYSRSQSYLGGHILLHHRDHYGSDAVIAALMVIKYFIGGSPQPHPAGGLNKIRDSFQNNFFP